jgi:hypothetical protein
VRKQALTPRQLAALGAAERDRVVADIVRWELAQVLRVRPESLADTGRPLRSLGVGSIAGLELQRRLEAALGVRTDLCALLAGSVAELSDGLAGRLGSGNSTQRHASKGGSTVGPLAGTTAGTGRGGHPRPVRAE